jgi:hypothetical protein
VIAVAMRHDDMANQSVFAEVGIDVCDNTLASRLESAIDNVDVNPILQLVSNRDRVAALWRFDIQEVDLVEIWHFISRDSCTWRKPS